jgi:hypothetical protein
MNFQSGPLQDGHFQSRISGLSKKAGVPHIIKFSGKESTIGYEAKKFRFTRMHEEIEKYLERSGLAWSHPSAEPIHAGISTGSSKYRRKR